MRTKYNQQYLSIYSFIHLFIYLFIYLFIIHFFILIFIFIFFKANFEFRVTVHYHRFWKKQKKNYSNKNNNKKKTKQKHCFATSCIIIGYGNNTGTCHPQHYLRLWENYQRLPPLALLLAMWKLQALATLCIIIGYGKTVRACYSLHEYWLWESTDVSFHLHYHWLWKNRQRLLLLALLLARGKLPALATPFIITGYGKTAGSCYPLWIVFIIAM